MCLGWNGVPRAEWGALTMVLEGEPDLVSSALGTGRVFVSSRL